MAKDILDMGIATGEFDNESEKQPKLTPRQKRRKKLSKRAFPGLTSIATAHQTMGTGSGKKATNVSFAFRKAAVKQKQERKRVEKFYNKRVRRKLKPLTRGKGTHSLTNAQKKERRQFTNLQQRLNKIHTIMEGASRLGLDEANHSLYYSFISDAQQAIDEGIKKVGTGEAHLSKKEGSAKLNMITKSMGVSGLFSKDPVRQALNKWQAYLSLTPTIMYESDGNTSEINENAPKGFDYYGKLYARMRNMGGEDGLNDGTTETIEKFLAQFVDKDHLSTIKTHQDRDYLAKSLAQFERKKEFTYWTEQLKGGTARAADRVEYEKYGRPDKVKEYKENKQLQSENAMMSGKEWFKKEKLFRENQEYLGPIDRTPLNALQMWKKLAKKKGK